MHPKGANSMAVSGLSLEKHMVGTERDISVLIGIIIIMDLEMSHLTL